MPALSWCGRKWRTSTDDFTFSGFFYFFFFLANATLALSRFRFGEDAFVPGCPDASRTFQWVFLALGVTDLVGAVAFLVTAWLSLQGAPFQVSKRRYVPLLLFLTSFTILVMLALSAVVTKYAVYDKEGRNCTSPTRHFLYAVIVFNFLLPVVYVITFAFVFDPEGRQVWRDSVEYESLWYKRCRLLCCCCLHTHRNKDAFEEISKTVAGLFCGYDLVPSDVAAGLLLVHKRQKRESRLRGIHVRYPSAEDERNERISLQARRFSLLTPQQRNYLADIRTYSVFYLSAYGWPLYQYMHCCTGLIRLYCFDPLMCCREHPGSHRGTKCYCDLAALLAITRIHEENVILTRWGNSPFRPVFFVVIDQSTDAVVVTIRGTMSFADCITDMVVNPVLLEVPDAEREANTTPADYYVHGGMQRGALYVLQELRESGVLDRILHEDFKKLNVVVLGHSLGAGVASILSIMLWSTEPTLRGRLRCIAYAPPGGLLSPALVAYSERFIVGCLAGNDIVPRLATHTLADLRESILDELMNTSRSKFSLFMNCLSSDREIESLSSSVSFSSERFTLRAKFRNSPCTPLMESKKLYPPATLVHYCKAVVREPQYCCCSGNRSCSCRHEEVFVPVFASPKDMQYVVCSASMLKDHLPDRLFDVIEKADVRLNNGELDRFFSETEDVGGNWGDYGGIACE
ncbi:hypothetical protein TCSYLVIO_006148 [Trypanosoma cruzi]|nr:hypothetical protein TCSYLVIO_006148 [Trypanosoma cruzi]